MSTASAEALSLYVDALDHLFTMRSAARASIDAALALDPEFALAHCVAARVALIEGDGKRARVAAAEGERLAASATFRERQHAALVGRLTRGETEGALDLVREHAASYPRDALPLSFALGVYGLLGFGSFPDHRERQRDFLELVAPKWPDDDWWLLSWLGWTYVEVGEPARGIAMLDRSLELRPDNATSAHGRAHGFYETGDIAGGQRFLTHWLPSYPSQEPLHVHLSWHLALGYLQLGDLDAATALFEASIDPAVSHALPMFTLVDAAAFAWRAAIHGLQVAPDAIERIEALRVKHFSKPGVPFVDAHAMATLALRDVEAAAEFRDAVAAASVGDANVARVTSAAVCDAILAYAERRYDECSAILRRVASDVVVLGGSNAQRDLVGDMQVGALLRSGDLDSARRVALDRASTRAPQLGTDWFERVARATPASAAT